MLTERAAFGKGPGRAGAGWVGVALAVVACSGRRAAPAPNLTPSVAATTPRPLAAPTASAVGAKIAAGNVPHYAIDATSLERLLVRVTFPRRPTGPLRVAGGAESFVSDAQVRTPAGVWPLERDEQAFTTTHCAEGCEVSYSFALVEAAQKLRDAELAERFSSAVVAPSSSWLLGAPEQVGYSLEVRAPAPNVFLTAFPPLDPARPDDTFASPA